MRERQPDMAKWLTGGRTRADVDLENREHRGRQQVWDYMEWAKANAEHWRILEYLPDERAVEVPFEITLSGITVIGFIDQLIEWRDGRITPRDLKTGSKLPDWGFQLGTYGIAVADTLDIECQWGDFYMAKNTATTEPEDLTRYSREVVGRWFVAMDRIATQGDFIPNPGDACRVCGVKRFCYVKGNEAHLYPITTESEAVA